jgi:hypothetical protein
VIAVVLPASADISCTPLVITIVQSAAGYLSRASLVIAVVLPASADISCTPLVITIVQSAAG